MISTGQAAVAYIRAWQTKKLVANVRNSRSGACQAATFSLTLSLGLNEEKPQLPPWCGEIGWRAVWRFEPLACPQYPPTSLTVQPPGVPINVQRRNDGVRVVPV